MLFAVYWHHQKQLNQRWRR